MKNGKNGVVYRLVFVMLLSSFFMLNGCKHDLYIPENGGSGSGGTICFESDVLPLFVSGCAKSGCHDAATKSEGYILDSYNNIIKKGIKPGDAKGSKIFEVLTKSGEERMPQRPNPAFTSAQISLIGQWINEGAKNTTNCSTGTCDTSNVTYSNSIAPIMSNNCVGCHNASLANGGYTLSTYEGVKNTVNNNRLIGAITYQPGFSGMPQGGHLTDCQIGTIKKWVAAGTPNN